MCFRGGRNSEGKAKATKKKKVFICIKRISMLHILRAEQNFSPHILACIFTCWFGDEKIPPTPPPRHSGPGSSAPWRIFLFTSAKHRLLSQFSSVGDFLRSVNICDCFSGGPQLERKGVCSVILFRATPAWWIQLRLRPHRRMVYCFFM